MADRHLAFFDADRIRDYVFATGRLKEIRGASEQIRRLTEELHLLKAGYGLQRWEPGGIGLIYAGGGGGAALFASADDAERFCRQLEDAFRRETRGATLSAVHVPVEADEGAALRAAARALRRRKAARPMAEEIPGGGPIRFCASDRLRPARGLAHDPDGAELLVSASTAGKRHWSNQVRVAVREDPLWEQHFEPLLAASRPATDVVSWGVAAREIQDLGDIGEQASPSGYIALVYADGDRVGELLRSVASAHGFAGYRQLSQALAGAAREVTAQALFNAYGARPPRGTKPRLPFEVISIGGDDILLICTAERGPAIAADIAAGFGPAVKRILASGDAPIRLDQALSASAGVLISQDSMPITQLERRGYELLRSAKRARDGDEGGIDFQIVSTPVLEPIKDLRARAYAHETTTMLTMRPYSGPRFRTLLGQARLLRGMGGGEGGSGQALPGSKRADLYSACQGSRAQATLAVLTVHARLGPALRSSLIDALAALDSVAVYPFAGENAEGVYQTALPDLLEAMEFVAEEGRWE